MKKDNGHLMIMLGIGKKRGSGLAGPPPMPKPAAAPQSAPDDEPPGAPKVEPDADDANVSGVDWDEALDYHENESCSLCRFIPEDSQQPCPVVKHPVNPQSGHCEAWAAKTGQGEQGQEMPEEQEMAQ